MTYMIDKNSPTWQCVKKWADAHMLNAAEIVLALNCPERVADAARGRVQILGELIELPTRHDDCKDGESGKSYY